MARRTEASRKRIQKKPDKSSRAYPIGTIAAYGPDDLHATKIVASVIEREGTDPTHMQKWFCAEGDARNDPEIATQVAAFFEQHPVKKVVTPDRIIGCPHEQGVDYEGDTCPKCEFWAIRDRWTGDVVH